MWPDPAQGVRERLDALRPAPWYRQPAIWISLIALLISILSLLQSFWGWSAHSQTPAVASPSEIEMPSLEITSPLSSASKKQLEPSQIGLSDTPNSGKRNPGGMK